MERGAIKKFLPPFLIAGTFILFAAWAIPFRTIFEFDTDEGINLAKAVLVAKGFPLYTQIWSDQPPLVSWLLALVFRVTGPSVIAGRMTILIFAAVLVALFFTMLRDEYGPVAAGAGAVLLAVSGRFTLLSVSIMIGMVSVSLFMMALYSRHVAKQSSYAHVWLAASGVLAGGSVLAKFFTLPLVAALAFLVIRERRNAPWWIGGLLVSLLPLFFIGSRGWEQLFRPHMMAYQNHMPGHDDVFYYMQMDYALFALALCGCVSALRRRDPRSALPLMWLVFAVCVILFHRPLFVHHTLLLTVPLAWLAVIGWQSIWSPEIPGLLFPTIRIVVVVIFSTTVIWKALFLRDQGRLMSQSDAEVAESRKDILASLAANSGGNQWIFTDRPIYAIRAGLLVPPEVAVMSMKRMMSTNWEKDLLPAVVEKYKVNEVLLARYTTYPATFAKVLQEQFVTVPNKTNYYLHFVRKSASSSGSARQ